MNRSTSRLALALFAVAFVVGFAAGCVGSPPVPCTQCDGQCVDLQSDSTNCGACGTTCAAGTRCEGGSCRVTCSAGLTACGQTCVDTRSNQANCGACGTACQEGEFCSAGTCTSACPQGTTRCDQGATPYCAATDNDSANCGACGVACAAGRACVAGACTLTCVPPLSLCGSATDAGFCSLTSDDPANCGACGRACAATEDCRAGDCHPRLLAGCEEVPNIGDAGVDQLLFYGRSPSRPYRVRCMPGSGAPRAFLMVDAGGNFAEFDNTLFGLTCATNVYPNPFTRFSGVRFDTATGLVSSDDYTFADVRDGGQVGDIPAGGPQPGATPVAWGTAGDCSCNDPQGDSRVDLVGTPFQVDRATTTFNLEGFMPSGGAVFTERNQVVTLRGGGFCGGINPRQPDGRPAVRLRYANTWSCASILAKRPTATSGVYNLFDGTGPGATTGPLAWCDMTNGGWTLLMKVDGRRADSAFFFESTLWSNDALFGAPVPDLTDTEAKYAAFATLPFSELRLVNAVSKASLTLPLAAGSMLEAVGNATPQLVAPPAGRLPWLTLFSPSPTAPIDGGVLQPNCNREAASNVSVGARVRLGLLANNEADCSSPDSYVGIGSTVGGPRCQPLPDGGVQGPYSASACGPGVADPALIQIWAR